MTGSLSARRLLGYDELGLLLAQFAPEARFPFDPFQSESRGMVMRSLKDDFIPYDALRQLIDEQQWQKKSS
jgi:antitoxin component of RelBE/YafQ-DinJ toxin-antitoxin module